jgi:uncharacterized protein (DUF342 family)
MVSAGSDPAECCLVLPAETEMIHMADEINERQRFGDIAVEMNIVDQATIDKALVVQKRIFEKTRVSMPIGQILVEMGAMTPDQRDQILSLQKESDASCPAEPPPSHHRKEARRSIQKENGSLDIDVSKNKLTVSATIDGEVPTTDFDVDDVKLMLHAEGILHGIAQDAAIKSFLNGELSAGQPWIIATGTDPVPDTPPQIIYHFDTDPLKIGTLTEDGLMDWKDRGELPQVKEGDLMAEKIPGPKGKEGMDVYGKKIPIPKQREKRFKCGKGARRSKDGLRVYARVAGIPKLSLTGELSVVPTLTIQGDISLETGHVTFDGHIEVAGAVEKGYRVKGGSLHATEIRGADIDIDGDISATNGVFGATIRCGGNLRVGHIHTTDITLAGDMAVEKEIIDSTIEANGRCLIKDGIIIASKISAKMGITAMDIGTEASHASELTVGIDQQLERETNTLKDEVQALKNERESLPISLKELRHRSDQVNTRLGDVAQEQDKCMVQHRRLQEKVEAGMLRQGGPAAAKLEKTIAELKARQDAYDQDVARLMDEDEAINQEIAETQKAISDGAARIVTVQERLETISEIKKTNLGIAVVKIGGTVFAGTQITGPHSIFKLQEDMKRLSIVETDKPDHDGNKRWRFELAPFR